ncbi:hypothetical protein SVAN01_01027 [Stagonosporopsis vannaccii]|nr:hypothetical protein SVAN01_01027 [Stagonosporopsis vannaccii]
MPPGSILYSTFQPSLAHTIASSKWRRHHETCFCDLALYYIEELFDPIDIVFACPDDMYSLFQTLNRIFTEEIVQDLLEEVSGPVKVGSCSSEDVDARIAEETWERHLRPWLARVLCIRLVDEAYEAGEREAVVEAEWKKKVEKKIKIDAEWRARSMKRDGIKHQMRQVAQCRLVHVCGRPLLGFVKEGFGQISNILADIA